MPLSNAFYSGGSAPAPAMFGELRQQAQAMNAQPPIPDLFARPMTPAAAQRPDAPAQAPQQPQQPPAQAPAQPGGQGNPQAAQMAQAALLYQLMQGGAGGFLGRLMPGVGMGGQRQGLGQAGQGFSLLNDPSIQALFNPHNVQKTNIGYRLSQMEHGQQPVAPGTANLAIDPAAMQNAMTFLQMLLGIHG